MLTPNTATKKGRYTYTRTPYTSCIPAENGHFWSYTNTYTVRSVDFSIYVYRLHTKKAVYHFIYQLVFKHRSYTISSFFIIIWSDTKSHFR